MISLWYRYALISLLAIHVDGSWVDPDTPLQHHSTDPLSPLDRRQYELVCLIWAFLRDLIIMETLTNCSCFILPSGVLRRVRARW
jgi:hypothetical protein